MDAGATSSVEVLVIVDDFDEGARGAIAEQLREFGVGVKLAHRPAEALWHLSDIDALFLAVVIDGDPGSPGRREMLAYIRDNYPKARRVVITDQAFAPNGMEHDEGCIVVERNRIRDLLRDAIGLDR